MTQSDCVLLADPACPTTYVYLAYLESVGKKFADVWVCDFAGGGRLDWIREHVGLYAALRIKRLQGALQMGLPNRCYWAHLMERSMPVKVFEMESTLHKKYLKHAIRITGSGWRDPHVVEAFRRSSSRYFLYSAGGIVSREVLSMPHINILHLHSGILPEVRGTDGLLWSLRSRGRPGVTAFWMDAGIDTGRILYRREFDPPCFAVAETGSEWERMYRALLLYYDTHLRAQTLLELDQYRGSRSWEELPVESQREGNPNYRAMSLVDRQAVLESLCR